MYAQEAPVSRHGLPQAALLMHLTLVPSASHRAERADAYPIEEEQCCILYPEDTTSPLLCTRPYQTHGDQGVGGLRRTCGLPDVDSVRAYGMNRDGRSAVAKASFLPSLRGGADWDCRPGSTGSLCVHVLSFGQRGSSAPLLLVKGHLGRSLDGIVSWNVQGSPGRGPCLVGPF